MASTVARNKTDVDNMARRERLWDSLNYSYGKKRENSDREYAKAYSQADRQALSRGMQRSSYNAQTLANIDKQRIDTQNDIFDAQIADYENRLQDIEQQELAQDQWERQFAEGQRQFDTNLAFQQKEADRAQANTVWNQNFQQAAADREAANTAWQQAFSERQYGDSRADAAWNRDFSERQYADSRADAAWNRDFSERQYADSRADTAWNQAFQQGQADLSARQWEQEFGRAGDNSDRQIAMGYISQIAAAGGNPSDELLRRAGLSRPDYNAMLMQAQAAGSATGGSGGGSSKGGNNAAVTNAYNALLAASGNGGNTSSNNPDDYLSIAMNWQPSGTSASTSANKTTRASDASTTTVNGLPRNIYSLTTKPDLKTSKK